MIIPLPILILISIIWSAYTRVTASAGGHTVTVSLGLLVLVAVVLALVASILWLTRAIIRELPSRRTGEGV